MSRNVEKCRKMSSFVEVATGGGPFYSHWINIHEQFLRIRSRNQRNVCTLTSCHALRASHRFMKPGDPLDTFRGSFSRVVYSCAGFWLGFMPYLYMEEFLDILKAFSYIDHWDKLLWGFNFAFLNKISLKVLQKCLTFSAQRIEEFHFFGYNLDEPCLIKNLSHIRADQSVLKTSALMCLQISADITGKNLTYCRKFCPPKYFVRRVSAR